MLVHVHFQASEGSESETFIIDTTKAPQDQLQRSFLACVSKALKSKDKTAIFTDYFSYDFISGLKTKRRKADNYVTIWY